MAIDTESFIAAHGDTKLCVAHGNTKVEGKSIFIPKGSTNGDVIKLIFPEANISEIRGTFDSSTLLGCRTHLGDRSQDYYPDWWNSEWKG